jgi:predicted Rossmann fold flavoprotein
MMIYDIAVIGGGAAGMMAAIRAAELGRKVVLIERNESLGKKILITGKGRCNITNVASIDDFMAKFGRSGQFLRQAFQAFFNDEVIEFFKSRGLETKTERQGRVFPVTDKARSVVEVLEKSLKDNKVEILFNTRLSGVSKTGDGFLLLSDNGQSIKAAHVIIATGGASYRATGSTGDGFDMAEKLGHKIIELKPGLVPLTTKEKWVKDLQGIALENIRITFTCGKKKIISEIGELMFTHFGVSGPLVIDLSADVIQLLSEYGEVKLAIDLKPGMRDEQLEASILHKFKVKGEVQMKNLMKDMLPNRMVEVFLKVIGVSRDKETNQITQDDRRRILRGLKGLELTINGSLPIEEAMVTGGGVSTKEIDPRSMQSRVVPGLYFAGEVIEGSAASGGYNLQQAFSTGYLAGESAANA